MTVSIEKNKLLLAGGRDQPIWWLSANAVNASEQLVWRELESPDGPSGLEIEEPVPDAVLRQSERCYASFSPSSVIPIFDNRYRSAFRDSPSKRAAWLLLPLARRSAS